MTHVTEDFVDHLAARLGVDRPVALFQLGDLLSTYEPLRPREIRIAGREPGTLVAVRSLRLSRRPVPA